jgi:hypothetical protein
MATPPRRLKPTPKDAIEIDQQFVNPYLANTNDGIVVEGHPLRNDRGRNFSFKDDKVKEIYIGLQDIDNAIMNYFNDTIQPTVVQDNNRMAVRTVYANPERWKSVQSDGFLRDNNGQIIVPVIMLKRDTVEKARGLGNKIDGNTIALYQIMGESYNRRNMYDQFDVINNRIPSKQYYVSTVPDYLTITYNVIIFTNFVEQNNKIVEAFEFASDSYWGDADRFKFRASIDSFSTAVTMENGGERVAKSTFNIKVNGYIIPDTISKDLATVRSKFYTKSQIIFDLETVSTIGGQSTNVETTYLANSAPAGNTMAASSFIGGGTNVTNTTITNNYNVISSGDSIYLNTNITKTANIISAPDTATFTGAAFLQPTAGSTLPATSVSNFTVYINGQFVPTNAITSFSESGGNVVVVFNTSVLGFTIASTDTITATGKFQ